MMHSLLSRSLLGLGCLVACSTLLPAQVAVRAKLLHTMAGPSIADGLVLIRDGKIEQVGAAAQMQVPEGYKLLQVAVATPGLIDARTAVGLSGYLNQDHDQDQLDRSAALQPELRAMDAYNPRERLVSWVRGFGVTTLHTGHVPGALISGQTMVVKTLGNSVEQALVKSEAMVAVTLGKGAQGKFGVEGPEQSSPGTRAKAMAMLRAALIAAGEYTGEERDLGKEVLAQVLAGKRPLLVTAHRAHDILTALRLAEEFKLQLVLDGASEAYLVKEQIKKAGVSVLVHPPMMRCRGETENATMELASILQQAEIPFAMQSGFESYVPKTRVVLWEAAVAAANGLSFDQALAAITIRAAEVLGLQERLGSLAVGKDADLALFDGDPFEYTTHCLGVVINGQVLEQEPR